MWLVYNVYEDGQSRQRARFSNSRVLYSWAFSGHPTLKVVIPRILPVNGVSWPTGGSTGTSE